MEQLVPVASREASGMVGNKPWEWDEGTWRGFTGVAGGGVRLLPDEWPGGARMAVAISFDSDHETTGLRDGKTSPGVLAQGTYGARVGVPRIVDMLSELDIRSTFFVPAVSALLHPDEVRHCASMGHEVALHGWIHERNCLLPYLVERDLTFRAAEVLERLTGVRPAGIRTPSWDFSENTLGIIRELGLEYDSSLMADDEPYELLEHGERTGVIEVPVDWIRDDAPYFMMERYEGLRPYIAPRDVAQIWRDEMDGALALGGVFQLTLHPHIIGHRSRLWIVRELLEWAVDSGQCWFATHAELADYVRTSSATGN